MDAEEAAHRLLEAPGPVAVSLRGADVGVGSCMQVCFECVNKPFICSCAMV